MKQCSTKGKAPLRGLLLEDARDVVVGLAGVNHEGKSRLPRRRDMGAEALLLIGARGIVVVIVEPGLADGHDLRMVGERNQFFRGHVRLFRRMMRMGADGAIDLIMSLGDAEHLVEAPHPRRDGDHQADARGLGAREHRLALRRKIGKIEMAVAIDQHHGKMKDPCCSGC